MLPWAPAASLLDTSGIHEHRNSACAGIVASMGTFPRLSASPTFNISTAALSGASCVVPHTNCHVSRADCASAPQGSSTSPEHPKRVRRLQATMLHVQYATPPTPIRGCMCKLRHLRRRCSSPSSDKERRSAACASPLCARADVYVCCSHHSASPGLSNIVTAPAQVPFLPLPSTYFSSQRRYHCTSPIRDSTRRPGRLRELAYCTAAAPFAVPALQRLLDTKRKTKRKLAWAIRGT